MSALPATFWTATARPFLNPDDMIDTAAQIAALSDQLAAGEAVYRAQRDLINLHLDAHRDVALARLGYL